MASMKGKEAGRLPEASEAGYRTKSLDADGEEEKSEEVEAAAEAAAL